VDPDKLTVPERALWRAFPRGELVDLTRARGLRARTIRAEVVSALLLGAVPPEPGRVGAVRLEGARITGTLDLGHAAVNGPVSLRHCEFEAAVDLTAAKTRGIDLEGSQLAGLLAPLAAIDGNLCLAGCACVGQVVLTGTRIAGALQMQKARLEHPGQVALLGNRLVVDDDLLAQEAVVDGQFRLAAAQIGGILGLDGATLRHEGRRALNGFKLTVHAGLLARFGFSATGEVALSHASIDREMDFRGATLSNPGGDALRCQYTRATTFILDSGCTVDGTVDLRYSRFTDIRDDPACWPPGLRLSGLSYDALNPPLPAAQRIRWLSRDTDGYLPQNYETLTAMYRALGDDAGARLVQLAKERERRAQLPWYGRAWSWLQEVTIGYGYRPLRATAWLSLFLAAGTLAFGLHHPPPLQGPPHPAFNPFIYTVDLLVPLIDLGLRNSYDPQGPQRWLAYLLIAAGWIFATTIATGALRVLRRQ